MDDEERIDKAFSSGEAVGSRFIYGQLLNIVSGRWKHDSGPASTDAKAEGLWKEEE